MIERDIASRISTEESLFKSKINKIKTYPSITQEIDISLFNNPSLQDIDPIVSQYHLRCWKNGSQDLLCYCNKILYDYERIHLDSIIHILKTSLKIDYLYEWLIIISEELLFL